MKKKSSKLAKLERNRFSVFFDDLNTCMNCGKVWQITKHEIFEGKNRQNSMKYGFVLPLCLKCHQQLQEDTEFNKEWKNKAIDYFEENIGTADDFRRIFRTYRK